MSEYPTDLAILVARSQEMLIEFLETEVSLAFTFLRTAALEVRDSITHFDGAVGKARASLAAVRLFQGRIQDHEVRRRIQERASSLESDLADFDQAVRMTGRPPH
jgi:hypothetical protein